MKDVRAVVLLGMEKGKRGLSDLRNARWRTVGGARTFSTHSNPLAIRLISFRNGLRVQRAGVAFLARSLLFQNVVACVSAGAVSCSRNPGQRGFAVMRRVPLAGAKKKP
jgi:hypothetical protein